MAALNKSNAKSRIKNIIGQYIKLSASDDASLDDMAGGKIYELYVLGRLLTELRRRGFSLRLVGSNIHFKSAPGMISLSDPHFDVFAPGHYLPVFKIFTDIEFRTFGAVRSASNEKCGYHELDIVVVNSNATGRPKYDEIALGIECKAYANFRKDILKQALGIRRELSLLAGAQMSILSHYQSHSTVAVPADPPSEFWLTYIDPKGNDYQTSPSVFGITFKHWQP